MTGREGGDGRAGWRPLQVGAGAAADVLPFTRLARTHALMAAGDALIAVALAGSLFFSISPDAARARVLAYLLLTMAPFAVVAPLVGPWIDRRQGGRRLMVILAAAGRAVICVLLIDDIDSLLLFPEAFAVLVLGKAYGVSRSSLVPGLVRDKTELVEANSKLSLISSIVGFVAAAPGVALLQIGAPWVLGLAVVVFAAATVSAFGIPKTRVAAGPADAVERAELRGAGILLAASAMGVLRGIVGFLAFLLAFALRDDGAPAWWFGVVLAASAGGALSGAAIAPLLRRWVKEERILLAALLVVTGAGLGAMRLGGRPSAAVLAAAVGVAASAAKLAFDSIVQRDAPDANQGRSFASFETRFQLAWVAGALLPVVFPLPLGVGYVVVAGAAGGAGFLYATGRRISAAHLREGLAAGREIAVRRSRMRDRLRRERTRTGA